MGMGMGMGQGMGQGMKQRNGQDNCGNCADQMPMNKNEPKK